MIRITRILGGIIVSGLVVACAGEDVNELNAWLDQRKTAPPPKVTKAQEPIKFTPEKYESTNLVDPFSAKKLLQGASLGLENQPKGSSLVQKELERRKEPLEQYPRDSMFFVGSLNRNGKIIGLIKLSNQLFYVKVGDYIGTNYGRIVSIKESELVLREVVQSATGDWEERVATLPLQEKI